MRSIYLFDLASQNNHWLSMRQTVLADNIANANTPGYRALDLEPFEAAMESARLHMAVTKPGHMAPDATATTPTTEVANEKSWEVFHSGSDVSMEQELIKAGDVNRAYSFNTGIIRAFSRMMLSSAKSGG